MDIHPPDEPIHSWRDVALHLGIVTVGILIALGLESLVEWRHHQTLANEARENIVSELKDNRAEVNGFLKGVPDSRKQIQAALGFTQELGSSPKDTQRHDESRGCTSPMLAIQVGPLHKLSAP